MNSIEGLRDDLIRRFPDIDAEIDVPAEESGLWVLDVRPGVDSPWIVIEWTPSLGFGISTPERGDFGTKPDELYPDTKAAFDRVVRLILCRGHTEPASAVRLTELRQLHNRSREEVGAEIAVIDSLPEISR
jgi:hypothetical protein